MSMMMLSPSLLKMNPSANGVAPAIHWISKSLNRCWSWSKLVKLAGRVEYTHWWRSCARTRLWRSRSFRSAMTRSTPSMWRKWPICLARSTCSSSFWWCISWSRCWSKHMICRSFCSAMARIWAMQRQRLLASSHGWRRCGVTTRTSWRSMIKPRSSPVIMPLLSSIVVKPCSSVPKTFARDYRDQTHWSIHHRRWLASHQCLLRCPRQSPKRTGLSIQREILDGAENHPLFYALFLSTIRFGIDQRICRPVLEADEPSEHQHEPAA